MLQCSGYRVPSSLDDFQAVIETTFFLNNTAETKEMLKENQVFCFSPGAEKYREDHPRSGEVECQCSSCYILSTYITLSTRHLDLCFHLMKIQVVGQS